VDLKVDGSLDETNAHLKSIQKEFESIEDNAHGDAHIWGHRGVSNVMNEFAENWRVHRENIHDRLAKLSEQVDQSCVAWTDIEKQLSDSLEVSGGEAGA
jgi:hypothetical protein